MWVKNNTWNGILEKKKSSWKTSLSCYVLISSWLEDWMFLFCRRRGIYCKYHKSVSSYVSAMPQSCLFNNSSNELANWYFCMPHYNRRNHRNIPPCGLSSREGKWWVYDIIWLYNLLYLLFTIRQWLYQFFELHPICLDEPTYFVDRNIRTAFRDPLRLEGIYMVDPLADKTNLKKPMQPVKLLSVEGLKKALRFFIHTYIYIYMYITFG